MILDLKRFVAAASPFWRELEERLRALDEPVAPRLDLVAARRLHYLYQRAASDLAQVAALGADPDLRRYLETLVARAYGEIHETRTRAHRLRPWRYLGHEFPRAFRRHRPAFLLALGLTVGGALFGAAALLTDASAKGALLPFAHLQGDPGQRVAEEERAEGDTWQGHKGSFSAALIAHNTRVAIFSLALGVTWGLGTGILLFYNGVILGAVSADYCAAGQTKFLLGWLLPHGAVEIPAFLISGQAGLVLAAALLGRGAPQPLRARLAQVGPDLVALVSGVAALLVWAGIVEAFLSQIHEPVLPYSAKIGLGLAEIVLLTLFLARAARESP